MSSDYRIQACSLPDHEELVAEIYFRDHYIGLISEERGPGSFVFELEVESESSPIELSLHDFERALQRAKDELVRLRTGPPPGRDKFRST